jgi:SPP1 family predicted phage head-tail adaptor
VADFTVNPGEMRTRITFQSPTESKDAGGAQTQGYANVGTNPTVWSKWVNAHGNEAVQSDALASVQRATVAIRHRTDILTTWQVLKDSEAWKIISIDKVRGENRWIELVVERAKGTV